MKINLGTLTEEETKQLAIEALKELPLAERVAAVLEAFSTMDDRSELMAWLEG
jgi:hypothetical protein